MKKNKTMRLAALLLALTLVTCCFVGGTFAKYITTADGTTTARVANWGFEGTSSITLNNLFSATYDQKESDYAVKSNDGSTLIVAPGTTGSAKFKFQYDETAGATPEVAYNFTVSTTGSSENIGDLDAELKWYLDDETKTTALDWAGLLAKIKALSGNASGSKEYKPGELPTAFPAGDTEHTIAWEWVFNGGDDGKDTALGNANDLQSVTLKISITAEQVDTLS